MNKKEAAEFLGCSERAIERYVKAGKISCRYEKGKTRSVAVFDKSELERFKGKGEVIRPAFEQAQEPTQKQRQTTTIDHSDLAILNDETVGIVGIDDISKLSAMVELLLNQQTKPSEKLVLTLNDCSQLTGFSRGILRKAIADNRLRAKIIGKSWRVKRADLENYIDQILN